MFLKPSPRSATQAEAILLSCGLSYEITIPELNLSIYVCFPHSPHSRLSQGLNLDLSSYHIYNVFPVSCILTIICRRGGGVLAYEAISFWYVALQWKGGC